MNPIRTFVTVCAVWVGAYLLYDGGVRLVDWVNSPPVESVRLEEPLSEVAVKEIEAEPKTDIDAEKPEVAPAVVAAAVAPAKAVPPVVAMQAMQAKEPAAKPMADVAPAPVKTAAVVAPQPQAPDVKPMVEAPLEPVSPVAPVTQVAAVVAVTEVPVVAPPFAVASAPVAAQPKDSAQKPNPVAEKSKEIQLVIKDIQFTGVTMFAAKELNKVVSEFLGKELTVQEAFAIPAKVTNHYKRYNHMAIATLVGGMTPEGVLTVGVVEMQMTQTQADKELAVIAPATAAAAAPPPPPLLSPPQAPLPTKSNAESETDYILKNYAKKSRQYEIVADNYGHASTGSARIGAAFAFDEDRFSLVGFKSQGSDYLRMAVRWATGIDGLKLGASLSHLNYQVVNHLETAIYQSGDAAKKSVELIYELVNEPGQISSLGLHYVSKSINSIGLNLADSASMTSRVPSLEWKGMLREMIPGGAVFTYNTTYSYGHVDTSGSSTMGGLEVPEGLFNKLRFDGTVMQPLGGLGSVFGRLTLQKSDKNLDPSERLYLGGPLGVRAYGVGEGVGSEGGLLSLEFRQRLDASTTLSEFYDWGGVRQVNDVNPTTVLKGYGLSLSQDMGGGVTLKGTWARGAGKHPQPSPQEGDGQYDRNRFWLSMESRF